MFASQGQRSVSAFVLAAASAAILLTSVQVAAQISTASVLGVVRDASGAVLPGVTIVARNLDTGQTRETVSDAQGAYRLPAVQVGRYEVRAELQGFKAGVRTGVTLSVTQEAVLDFSLEVGAIEESVVVTGEAPLIFNLTNRVNFGMPNAAAFVGTQTNPSVYDVATGVTASNPLGTAGQITTTATTSRQMQLSLRWSF